MKIIDCAGDPKVERRKENDSSQRVIFSLLTHITYGIYISNIKQLLLLPLLIFEAVIMADEEHKAHTREKKKNVALS